MQYCKNDVKSIGMMVDGKVRIPILEREKKVLECKIPQNLSELRSFLRLVGWLRGFIEKFSDKVSHMTNRFKTKKKWVWSNDMQVEFDKIKEEVENLKGLGLLDYEKKFILRTDTSNSGLGAVLLQEDGKRNRKPIEWASRKLAKIEGRYVITGKEMLACFWAIKKFEYELRAGYLY